MEKPYQSDYGSCWTGRPVMEGDLVSHWGGVPTDSLGVIFLGSYSDHSLTFDDRELGTC